MGEALVAKQMIVEEIQMPPGSSSQRSVSTCSSTSVSWSDGAQYAASVASPSGGNKEYLIGRKKGLVASVNAGRMNLMRMPRC